MAQLADEGDVNGVAYKLLEKFLALLNDSLANIGTLASVAAGGLRGLGGLRHCIGG